MTEPNRNKSSERTNVPEKYFRQNKTEKNSARTSKTMTSRQHTDSTTTKKSKGSNKKTGQLLWTKDHKDLNYEVELVQKKIRQFKRKNMGPRAEYNFEKCIKCLEENILPFWNLGVSDIKDYDTFLQLTLRKEIDEDIAGSNEFIDLLTLADRAQDFDLLVLECKKRLSVCLEKHAKKSFKSMREDINDQVILPIEDYDDHIKEYSVGIEGTESDIKDNLTEYKKLLKPFLNFVKDGDMHGKIMKKVCDLFSENCQFLLKWCKEDQGYPSKLQEQFNSNSVEKEQHKREIRECFARKEENNKQIEETRKQEERSGARYMDQRKKKHKLKAKKEELNERKEWIEEKLVKKRKEKDEIKEEQKQAPESRSARDDFSTNERLEELDAEIDKLVSQKKVTNRQLRRVEREFKPTNEKSYENKVDTVTHRHDREAIEKDNRQIDDEIKQLKDLITSLDTQNQTLKMIRELRLSPELQRKYERQKMRQQICEINGAQSLSEACRYAAPSVGKDWKKLYLTLPFNPPRDVDKRKGDVDLIDFISARNDVTVKEQALKSLDKWRTFHRHGDIWDLIDSLRRVRKKSVARQIQIRFTQSAV